MTSPSLHNILTLFGILHKNKTVFPPSHSIYCIENITTCNKIELSELATKLQMQVHNKYCTFSLTTNATYPLNKENDEIGATKIFWMLLLTNDESDNCKHAAQNDLLNRNTNNRYLSTSYTLLHNYIGQIKNKMLNSS